MLDLFSGIGGFSLGLERAGMETVAFCEIDPWCQKILKKNWPDVPIYEDVRRLDYEGPVDLICGDTLASRKVQQGSKEARKMTVGSGLLCLPSSKNTDQIGLLEKMLLGTSIWNSTMCLLTWGAKATPQGRLLFQLVPSMPPTGETESGFWHTPNTMDSLPPRGVDALKRQYENNRRGRTEHSTLREQVIYPKPKVMFPTPTANEDAAGTPNGKMQKMLGNCPEVRGKTEEEWNSGTLNPMWVEWLMGFPIGWTELED